MLNKHFDNIYCINLARRPDRWKEAQAEFKKHGIKGVARVEGVDGQNLNFKPTTSTDGTPVSKGDLGCTKSHLSVVEWAKKGNLPYYLVFEDDVELHPNFNALFEEYYKELPDDWDMFYLGANHGNGYTEVSDHIIRCKASYATHAMVVRHTMYDDLIKFWNTIEKVDIMANKLHPVYNCYGFYPNIAWQRDSYSDILEKFAPNPAYMKPNDV